MLCAIAFCPAPPLLVPAVAAGAAGELDGLRAACAAAVDRLLGTGPEEVVVLGPAARPGRFPGGTAGTLTRYGVPVAAVLPDGEPPGPRGWYGDPLPLSLTLGAWLLERAGAEVPCPAVAVAPADDPAAVAATLAGRRHGLLVMGDGSARRSVRAPGYVDPRAAGFDAAVATALGRGDAAALRDLDPVLGAELLAAGVPAWRVAGHAAAGLDPAAELLHDEAPYGVGYLVAVWTAR